MLYIIECRYGFFTTDRMISIFFFKQKTAYEMLISYWSSDVCSSDLGEPQRRKLEDEIMVTPEAIKSSLPWKSDFKGQPFTISYVGFIRGAKEGQIGRASCREGVCKYE